jgi:phage shock protein PspC (stress-responsive transcriptional regulator)
MTWNDSPNGDPTGPSGPFAGRRLVRRQEGKVLAGVCTGLADYFNVDVNVVRLVTIVLVFATGIALPAYLVAWLVVPEAGADQSELERLIDRFGVRSRPTDGGAA